MKNAMLKRCASTAYQKLINYCGVIYTLSIVIAILAVNAYYTCPQLYTNDKCKKPVLFGYFLISQIAVNLFFFHWHRRRNTLAHWFSGQLLKLSDCENSFVKYCLPCHETVPVGSHHCALCRYCVLRKDHHCFMVGGCVGFGNQRYFIVFLFWAAIGAFYGTSYTVSYLDRHYERLWPYGWIYYIGPVAMGRRILFGTISLPNLGLAVLCSLAMTSALAASAFFLSQIFFVLNATTMYDYSKNSNKSRYYHQISQAHCPQ